VRRGQYLRPNGAANLRAALRGLCAALHLAAPAAPVRDAQRRASLRRGGAVFVLAPAPPAVCDAVLGPARSRRLGAAVVRAPTPPAVCLAVLRTACNGTTQHGHTAAEAKPKPNALEAGGRKTRARVSRLDPRLDSGTHVCLRPQLWSSCRTDSASPPRAPCSGPPRPARACRSHPLCTAYRLRELYTSESLRGPVPSNTRRACIAPCLLQPAGGLAAMVGFCASF
jgi:hypothetical protein